MWLIVGLGNAGAQYAFTRHNLGFMVVDRLMENTDVRTTQTECWSQVAQSTLEQEKVLLVKPRTFMNRSGRAVACLTKKYNIPSHRTLVIMDDISLPFGKLRLRPRGRDGGHQGLKSILESLDSMDVPRLRLGIFPVEGQLGDVVTFVLSRFNTQEWPEVEAMVARAETVTRALLRQGVTEAMNQFNT